jgi:hypothetical protein
MSLYWLCYRVGESFEGVAIVEATSLPEAQRRAEVEGHEINAVDVRAIPRRFMRRRLGEDEVTDLEHILVSRMPKKPPRRFGERNGSGRERARNEP